MNTPNATTLRRDLQVLTIELDEMTTALNRDAERYTDDELALFRQSWRDLLSRRARAHDLLAKACAVSLLSERETARVRAIRPPNHSRAQVSA